MSFKTAWSPNQWMMSKDITDYKRSISLGYNKYVFLFDLSLNNFTILSKLYTLQGAPFQKRELSLLIFTILELSIFWKHNLKKSS